MHARMYVCVHAYMYVCVHVHAAREAGFWTRRSAPRLSWKHSAPSVLESQHTDCNSELFHLWFSPCWERTHIFGELFHIYHLLCMCLLFLFNLDKCQALWPRISFHRVSHGGHSSVCLLIWLVNHHGQPACSFSSMFWLAFHSGGQPACFLLQCFVLYLVLRTVATQRVVIESWPWYKSSPMTANKRLVTLSSKSPFLVRNPLFSQIQFSLPFLQFRVHLPAYSFYGRGALAQGLLPLMYVRHESLFSYAKLSLCILKYLHQWQFSFICHVVMSPVWVVSVDSSRLQGAFVVWILFVKHVCTWCANDASCAFRAKSSCRREKNGVCVPALRPFPAVRLPVAVVWETLPACVYVRMHMYKYVHHICRVCRSVCVCVWTRVCVVLINFSFYSVEENPPLCVCACALVHIFELLDT